jgi:hypothetical protein
MVNDAIETTCPSCEAGDEIRTKRFDENPSLAVAGDTAKSTGDES